MFESFHPVIVSLDFYQAGIGFSYRHKIYNLIKICITENFDKLL